ATAEYDSMLVSAIRTGLVDREMPVEEMGVAFVRYLVEQRPLSGEPPVGDGDRARICRVLLKHTGHDFSGYKSATVDRRVRRRMQLLGCASIAEYVDKLEG